MQTREDWISFSVSGCDLFFFRGLDWSSEVLRHAPFCVKMRVLVGEIISIFLMFVGAGIPLPRRSGCCRNRNLLSWNPSLEIKRLELTMLAIKRELLACASTII